MFALNMNIKSLRKQLEKDLSDVKKIIDKSNSKSKTKTYNSLKDDFDKLTSYYTNEKGNKVYKSNKKSLLKFSDYLKQFTPNSVTKKAIKDEKQSINNLKVKYNKFIHSDKKVVACYASFFIRAHDKYSKTPLFHDYSPYQPTGNDYYLSKTINFAGSLAKKILNELKHLPNTRGDEYLEMGNYFREYLSEFEGFDDFNEKFYDLIVSKEPKDILMKISHVNIQNVDVAPLTFELAKAYDSTHALHLSNKFISNHIKTNSYTSQYVNENFLVGSCWYSLIIDTYKESIEKRYKNFDLTYDSLHQILFPEQPLKDDYNGASYKDVLPFFKKYKLAICLFDMSMNLITRYEPDIRNRNVNPRIIYVIYHNEHVFRLNHNLKELEQTLERCALKITEPNTKFFLSKSKPTDCKIIKSFEDLKAIIEDKTIKGDIKLIYNGLCCKDLWIRTYNELKYEPEILMKDGKVDFSHLQLKNINDQNITIEIYNEKGVNFSNDEIFNDDNIFKNYINKKNNACDALISRKYLSHYNYQVGQMLKDYAIVPMVGSFDLHGKDIQCIDNDYNKYYTSIYNNLEYLPVINSFDRFCNYDGHKLEKYTLYYVAKTNKEYEYPINDFSLCFGINLDKVECDIISYLRPSKLVKNDASTIIQDIYNDKSLTDTMKKNIINHIIGKFNKTYNKKFASQLFTNENECNSFVQKYDGKKKLIPIDIDKYLYVNYIEKKSIMTEGFKLISFLIYDTARKKLLELKKRFENFGFIVYGCNTDAIYINNDYELFEQFKECYADMYDEKAIGKLKFNSKTINCTSLVKRTNFTDNYKEVKIQDSYIIPLKNEFDNDEISDAINQHNRLIVKADIAGAGKTSACIHYCKKYNKRALFITPYNALSQNLRLKDGVDAITFCKLMGTIFDGEDVKEQGSNVNIDDYDVIIFDEVYLYDTIQLQKIEEFIHNNHQKKYLATGDEYQLSPIEILNADINNKKLYYNNIVKSIFDTQIQLHENKRCKNDEDRALIKEITKLIREASNKFEVIKILKKHFRIINEKKDITSKKNVCLLNRTVEIVNNIVHVPLNNEKYYEGLMLICKKRYKYKSDLANLNYTYTIENINENLITLIDDEENKMIMSKETVEEHFKLSYARTCNSYQGMSENEPITIFDIDHFYVDNLWIYTAITRATSLDNISIFLGNLNTDINLNDVVDKMIASHKYNDIKVKRTIRDDYVTRDWVLNELKRVKICRRCTLSLDVTGNNCFSINRINNKECHSISNCEIICLRCNKALGNRII